VTVPVAVGVGVKIGVAVGINVGFIVGAIDSVGVGEGLLPWDLLFTKTIIEVLTTRIVTISIEAMTNDFFITLSSLAVLVYMQSG